MTDARKLLQRMMDGNHRYVDGEMEHPRIDAEHRQTQVDGQNPIAVVLCCADSRVVPELIFDCGVGDLFTIRVAGNVLDESVKGSIEYAVAHLDVKLIMVLGHEGCGAVTAAIAGTPANSHIDYLIDAIRPAVVQAREAGDDSVDGAVRYNAVLVGDALRHQSPILEPRVKSADIKVVSAIYHLSNGEVEVLKRNDLY